jgi:hypothetical protein
MIVSYGKSCGEVLTFTCMRYKMQTRGMKIATAKAVAKV